MPTHVDEEAPLILAAEDCPPEQFDELHRFSQSDERLIRRLIAHGPVLVRGGRGSGKSALMIEASRRLAPANQGSSVLGVYLSLRHLELLRSASREYERYLCDLLIREVNAKLDELDPPPISGVRLGREPRAVAVQRGLSELSSKLAKRIVLFFDDAAHIGREASLSDFFDIFRTISSTTVSCKAAIYPGVTKFGTRFDVFNDATVIEVARSEELPGFAELFSDIMQARYPKELSTDSFSRTLTREHVASFLGQAVLGNMRAFVYACNALMARRGGKTIGLTLLNDTLLELARNHFWPLLEELTPKLGIYRALVGPAQEIAQRVFGKCGTSDARRSAVIWREIAERLSKPLEILEYSGFIARREVSRGMKSGGRGARYAVNLCNLLEQTPGSRLTQELFERWTGERADPIEFHRGSELSAVVLPELDADGELEILRMPVEKLKKSNAYPYGLTDAKVEVLREAGITTVGQLADTEDSVLLSLPYVGPKFLTRFRNVVGQAVWM